MYSAGVLCSLLYSTAMTVSLPPLTVKRMFFPAKVRP